MTTPNQKNEPTDRTIRDMSGYIARNDRRTNDRQPQWRGKVTINGKEYYLSLWEKTADLMNLSVTDPDTLPPRPNQAEGQGASAGSNQGTNAPASGSNQGSQSSGYPSAQAQPPVGGDPFGDIFTP